MGPGGGWCRRQDIVTPDVSRHDMADHTSAGFSADTEVLTRRGWLTFDQATCQDEVATRSPDGRFEWQHPEHLSAERYQGPMLHLRSQVFDLMVAPEHPLPLLRRGQRGQPDSEVPVLRPAAWFRHVPSRSKWWRIPTTSSWAGSGPGAVNIPAAERMRGRHHPAPALRIEARTWMRFLGWFLSEGNVCSAPYLQNVVTISQIRNLHKPEIRGVLDAMNVRWRTTRGGFEFNHGPLAQQLRVTCYGPGIHHAWNKRVPDAVKGYSPGLLAEMFDSMMKGDGHVEKTGLRRYVTTSRVLADDVVEVLQKMGSQGWYHTLTPPRAVFINGSLKATARRLQYRVTERPGHASNTPVPAEVPYSGMIYCASVPNGIIYVRRNGRTAWAAGNLR